MRKVIEVESYRKRGIIEGLDTKVKLQTLWIFAVLNMAYADIHMLFDKSIVASLSQGALLGSAVLMETAIVMVLLSRILPYRSNRWANIVIGLINTLAVLASLFVGTPHAYYIFFAVIEIAATLAIIWIAWTWPKPEVSPST